MKRKPLPYAVLALATLGANESSFSDNADQPALYVLDTDPASLKYGGEAFNGAGKSDRKGKKVSSFRAP